MSTAVFGQLATIQPAPRPLTRVAVHAAALSRSVPQLRRHLFEFTQEEAVQSQPPADLGKGVKRAAAGAADVKLL